MDLKESLEKKEQKMFAVSSPSKIHAEERLTFVGDRKQRETVWMVKCAAAEVAY